MVGTGTHHSKRLLAGGGLIMLFLTPEWVAQFDSPPLRGIAVESLRDLILRDHLIGSLTDALRRDCLPLSAATRSQAVALAYALAARLIAALALPSASPSRRLSNETMDRIAARLSLNASERIPPSSLAREAGVSPSHFRVLFKATTGMTCEQYILRHRILRAKSLIETGNYTIGQVAHMTGFADHSHLTKAFTRLLGAPPRSFFPRVRTA